MRGLVKLVIGLTAIGGLLVGADRIAVGVAEDQAAGKMVSSGRLSTRPHVTIEDFPFLPHVAAGRIDRVNLSAADLTVKGDREQVSLHSFSADLSGVELGSGYRSVKVASAHGTAVISYADVARLAGVPEVGFAYGGPGTVQLTVLGQPVASGQVHSRGNTVVADGIQLEGLAKVMGRSLPAGLTSAHSFSVNGLPAGLQLASVTPQQDGLKLNFQGSGLDLTG